MNIFITGIIIFIIIFLLLSWIAKANSKKVTKSVKSLESSRKTGIEYFNLAMERELSLASRFYPNVPQPINQSTIIVAGFYAQSRELDPDAKGKYKERTILDPVNFKPIDSLTLKPLKTW